MSQPVPVICIDGPGGSGKGTISALLARRFGFHMLDSGALYRLVGLAAMQNDVGLSDGPALGELAAALDLRFNPDADDDSRVTLSGSPVGNAIRTEAIAAAASQVAGHAAVRAALLDLQHDFRRPPGLVADGRDMGTIVFPDAPVKVFLTASAEERAKRRHRQLNEQGVDATFAGLLSEICERDERDRSRILAPLIPAPDAVTIDTSQRDIPDVLEEVTHLVRQRLRR